MPTYSITGPDNKTYSIDGPEGATREQIIAKIQERQAVSAPRSYGALEVPGEAIQNLPASAVRLGESMVQPFIHPIETAKNIGKLGLGVSQKLGLGSSVTGDYTPYADAVGQFIKDRYGGWEPLKRTMAEDPAGFVADLSTVLFGGGGIAARAPGLVGKVGEIVSTVGRLPAKAVTKAVEKAPEALSHVGGLITGTGAENILGGIREGFAGRPQFLENLRNPELAEGIVQKTRQALGEIRLERSAAYQRDIAPISKDPTVLNFNDVDAAINKAHAIKQFRGRDVSALVGANERLPADIVKSKLENAVAAWRRLDPKQYHTPAGFDALKQYIGDVRDHYQYGTPERKVAEDIYSAVRGTIVKQAPDYAKVMKNYQEASDKIDEITKTLSLGRKTRTDTALRKLLSATRSNVNTNFGKRLDLVKELNRIDPTILPSLQGQALSSLTPTGLRGVGAGAGGAFELGNLLMHGAVNPAVLAAIVGGSPRLWGELAYKLGQGGRKTRDLTPQQIMDLAKRANPDVLQQLGLGARAVGGAGGEYAAQ